MLRLPLSGAFNPRWIPGCFHPETAVQILYMIAFR
jgi:hypothetical protein